MAAVWAPHSFFDRSFAEREQACVLAWVHLQEFLGLSRT